MNKIESRYQHGQEIKYFIMDQYRTCNKKAIDYKGVYHDMGKDEVKSLKNYSS